MANNYEGKNKPELGHSGIKCSAITLVNGSLGSMFLRALPENSLNCHLLRKIGHEPLMYVHLVIKLNWIIKRISISKNWFLNLLLEMMYMYISMTKIVLVLCFDFALPLIAKKEITDIPNSYISLRIWWILTTGMHVHAQIYWSYKFMFFKFQTDWEILQCNYNIRWPLALAFSNL